jgi:Nuclease-related domain
VSAGTAGASALARADQLEERVVNSARRKWGDHAAVVAARIAEDDPSIRAWMKGGDGESRLAVFLDREVGDTAIALHDRVIPGTRGANIDHIYVSANGVWVVDAKSYKGKVEKRDVGPFWRDEIEFSVGGRNRTKLVDGLGLQVKAIRAALEPDPEYGRVDVRPVLCFVDSDWDVLARPFDVRGVTVLYPGALPKRLKRRGDLTRAAMQHIAKRLALSLPAAA